MTSFNEIEGLKDKVKIVVNRVGLDSGQISLKKAQETIGKEIYWQIPNDYATMVEARNNGVPMITQSPRAKITRSIEQLAHSITESSDPKAAAEAEDKKKGRTGLFRFLGAGSK